ncbi:MAG: PIG-L family deacetylase [Ferruginibacter sp.]
MIKVLAALLLLTVSFNPKDQRIKSNVILIVFAHPDDETAIGPLLVKYGKMNKVYLLIVTDGRLGTRPGFPTGDSLAKLRQTESECSCKIMGIEPPVFLGFTDGFDTRIGVGKYLSQSKLIKEQITKRITALNPDIIITFGPDGDTGHSDHRMVSNITTEIILKEGWLDKYPLYYLGWTKKDDEKFTVIGGLNTVDEKYLNVAIKYSEQDEQKALEALNCDKSQLSSEEIKEWKEVERKDTTNTLYFRQLAVSKQHRTNF